MIMSALVRQPALAYSGIFPTPMHVPRADFSIEHVQCWWQRWPGRADVSGCARARLAALSVDATGLHRDPLGRPRLPEGAGDIGWSHSAGRLLMAYTRHGLVGVDVEASGRATQAMAIARRYFAPDEADALARLDASSRQPAFLRMWCAKEAVLKAAGRGLAFGLDRVAFDVAQAQPRMTRCDPGLGRVDDWSVHQFAPEAGFIAVLARRD